jgi:hypothetical protein
MCFLKDAKRGHGVVALACYFQYGYGGDIRSQDVERRGLIVYEKAL